MWQTIAKWAKALKKDVLTLWFAMQSKDTPTLAKIFAFLAIAYGLSPIDIIPDFIPIIGYLDDFVILPILVWIAVYFLPEAVLQESREKADTWIASKNQKPVSIFGIALFALVWIGICALVWRAIKPYISI